VKGVNAQLSTLSFEVRPVIAAARLRKGDVVSGHGADRLIPGAVGAARAVGATGQVLVRADRVLSDAPIRRSPKQVSLGRGPPLPSNVGRDGGGARR